MIAALRDGFGFIRCADRDARMFFHFNEVIDSVSTSHDCHMTRNTCEQEAQLTTSTEVEFSVHGDYTEQRYHAVRIWVLPSLSVKFEIVSDEVISGNVQEELPHDTVTRNKPNIFKLQK